MQLSVGGGLSANCEQRTQLSEFRGCLISVQFSFAFVHSFCLNIFLHRGEEKLEEKEQVLLNLINLQSAVDTDLDC